MKESNVCDILTIINYVVNIRKYFGKFISGGVTMAEVFSAVPEFMWNNIFAVINTLICGLIVAFFTSTFLKKKEERTRIAGVIVEKRINSGQDVLHFLEHELFKEEINIENSSRYDAFYSDALEAYGLPDPHEGHIQYARIFLSMDKFEPFFHAFEDKIMTHKLWLDTKVRTHLVFMQLYFSVFNTIPLMVKRISLPQGRELTDEEFGNVCNKVLLLLGISCDGEINGFMSELDELIVDSVYKLELRRPRKSMMRDNMYNVDMEKCQKRLMRETIPGVKRENIFRLVMDMVYETKGINLSGMTNEEYDEFVKAANPDAYKEMQEEFQVFKESLEKMAKEKDVKIVSKKDLGKYSGQYGISLKDILEGREIQEIDAMMERDKMDQ